MFFFFGGVAVEAASMAFKDICLGGKHHLQVHFGPCDGDKFLQTSDSRPSWAWVRGLAVGCTFLRCIFAWTVARSRQQLDCTRVTPSAAAVAGFSASVDPVVRGGLSQETCTSDRTSHKRRLHFPFSPEAALSVGGNETWNLKKKDRNCSGSSQNAIPT